jgi:two-component system response regulator
MQDLPEEEKEVGESIMKDKVIPLAEDNPDDVQLTLRALKKNNILNEVIVAPDGVEALDYLFGAGKYAVRDTNIKPQAILLDIKMPRMDGLEVLNRKRSDERTKLLPVIILTTSSEEKDRIESYKLGANSYIRKPVDFIQFASCVQQLGLYWLVLNEGP